MVKGIAAGIVLTLAAGLLGAYLFVSWGLMPANADARPPALEKWAARKSLKAAIAREAPTTANPVALNDEDLIAGVKLYAANCLVCHGAADGAASNIAKGLYQHAPQFGRHGVTDDPEGETYWKIDHGIRMTGMPSFGGALSETQMWRITLFLKHMKELTPGAEKAWKALPSQAAGA
ncbi:MAG TPA: c-type cytochrome [Elusimicrobiota bacterium]|jgi:mono/diheme cytochrome c family protein|nr:c-type cytochrome [Elusimicrobiota bacterium]